MDDDDFEICDEVGEMGGRQRSNSAPLGERPALFEEVDVDEEDDEESPLDGKVKRRNITVIARFRPENAYEVANGGVSAGFQFGPDGKSISMRLLEKVNETHEFMFNRVFQSYSTQKDMFDYVGEPILDGFFSGANCSVMAYGQTGTGKTYTMMGVVDARGNVVAEVGIIPQLFGRIFRKVQEEEDTATYDVIFTFVELYMERVIDLFGDMVVSTVSGLPQWMRPPPAKDKDGNPYVEEKPDIRLAPDGTMYVSNVKNLIVRSVPEALSAVQLGLQRRSTAATKQNELSSRSHAVLVVTMHSKDRESKVERHSQLYLVDLAGSEKVAKTETFGMRLEEAKMINKSLFSLGQVITALTSKRKKKTPPSHVPYRDSKLTRLLQNSLGGNAITFVIATCTPNSFNEQETLSTLRFGSKAQLIKTLPTKNVFRTVEELEYLLQQAKQEIDVQRSTIVLLKNQLRMSGLSCDAERPGTSLGTSGTNKSSSPQRPTTSFVGSPATGGRLPPATGAAAEAGLLQGTAARRLASVVQSVSICPLSQNFMKDPVVALDGFTYERSALARYLTNESNGMRSPTTGERINASLMIPNLVLKSLFSMCRDAGLNLMAPMDEKGRIRPVTSCFLVFDIVDIIVSNFPLPQILAFARVNTTFARVCYDRSRWTDAVKAMLQTASNQFRDHVATATLPAHKVYLMLKNGEGSSTQELSEKLSKLQFRSGGLALYSNGLKSRAQ